MEPTTDSLDDILKKLLVAIPEVKAAAIVSKEGLPIASALPQGVDETRIAVMIAALLSLAETATNEMKRGEFNQLYVKGSKGYLLVLQAGPNAVLAVSTTKDVKLEFPLNYNQWRSTPPGSPGATGSALVKEDESEY